MNNLRYSARMLCKNPGVTAAVVATLMLGIGATTAIYTVVYAVLLAPLPYPQPEQLVMAWSKVSGHDNGISAGDFLDWKQQSHSFQQLAAWTGGSFNLATAEQPEQIVGKRATPGWFDMQGIPFLFGRDFLPEEGVPGHDREVILTHKLWNRLGANRSILGQALRLNGESYTVVGVLAPGVGDRFDEELTVPLAFRPEQINHDYHWLLAMGRLKPGVTLQQAQADMNAVTARIAVAYPQSNKGWGASIEPLQNDFLPKERIRNLWLLLGAVGFVLLIACVNVANLLLAKGAGRLREIAIRGAVGAGRARIFAQFLVESLLLALIGGGLGIGLGVVLLRAILNIVPEGILPSGQFPTRHSRSAHRLGGYHGRRPGIRMRAGVVRIASRSRRIVERGRCAFWCRPIQPSTPKMADRGRVCTRSFVTGRSRSGDPQFLEPHPSRRRRANRPCSGFRPRSARQTLPNA